MVDRRRSTGGSQPPQPWLIRGRTLARSSRSPSVSYSSAWWIGLCKQAQVLAPQQLKRSWILPHAAKPAAAPTVSAKSTAAPAAPTADPKADSVYAQAQKAIAGLAPEQKKELVTMIQADPKVKAALSKPAVQKPVAAPTAPQAMAKPKIKQPLKIKGAKQAAPQPQQQLAASKENLGNMVAENFSIFRKH